MNLNSYVGISLPRNCSRFYKIGWLILIQIITTLYCRNFLHRLNVYLLMHLLSRSTIYRFLSSTHWFVIELTTLFLKLIITNVKGISPHAMITHPHLILLIKVLLQIVLLFHYVILVIISTNSTILSKYRSLCLFTAHATLSMVAITISGAISIIVVINTMRILRRLTILWSLNILRTWPRLGICNVHITGTSFLRWSCSWVSWTMHLSRKLAWIVDIILFIIRLMWINMSFLRFLNLPGLQAASLVFLVNLLRLFLRTSVKITACYSEFFHLNLRIDSMIIVRFLWMIFISRISVFLNSCFNSTFLTRWTLRINSVWIYLRR